MSTTYRRDFGQPLDYQHNLVQGVLKHLDKIPGSNCCNLIDSTYGHNKSTNTYPPTTPAVLPHTPEKKCDCPVGPQQTTAQQQKITTKCSSTKPCRPPLCPSTHENIQGQHYGCPQLRSTYQIEFCHLCDGDYKDDAGWIRLPSLLKPLSKKEFEYRVPKDIEEIFDVGKDDTGDFQQGNLKVRRVSEYVGTIGRLGCVIVANKIHDHSKCNLPTNCRHTISHFC